MADYQFRPEERPILPGSPYSPAHPVSRRLGYALVAVVVGLCSTFSNALIQVNTNVLGGPLGLDLAQVTWLPAVYVAANASASLILVKARFQYGPMHPAFFAIGVYLAAAIGEAFFPGFLPAVITRATCGIASSALTTLTIYNGLQASPAKYRPIAIAGAIVIPQFGTPFARMVPVEWITAYSWTGLHVIEICTALLAIVALRLLPLPPTDRVPKVFERLDFLTMALMVPAFFLISTVIGLGKLLWWTDTPWLGGALAAGIALLGIAIVIEGRRARPLLFLDWMVSKDFLRFVFVGLLVRIALSEQTYGAVGLLTQAGLTNDQLRELFAWVSLAMVIGVITTIVLLILPSIELPRKLALPVMVAALLIGAGALLDADSSSLTRPEQLYLSQSLIGGGSAMFIGPTLAYGVLQLLKKGSDHLVTLFLVFSTTQNVGGLAGSALLGSLEFHETRKHAEQIALDLAASNPLVAERLRQGSASLTAAISREANVLAFHDVFRYIALGAFLFAAWLALRITAQFIRERRIAAHARINPAPIAA